MAHIWFNKGKLLNYMASIVKQKIGIVLSPSKVTELLKNSDALSILVQNNTTTIRLEFSKVEFVYHEILKALGYDLKVNHYALISNSIKEYIGTSNESLSMHILEDFIKSIQNQSAERFNDFISEYMLKSLHKYGYIGLAISYSIIDHFCKTLIYSLTSKQKIIPFNYTIKLEDLSKPLISNAPTNDFSFDKRFINYLNSNFDKIDVMHWRNFEVLVGQYFKDNGFDVEIKKGTKDGGVDLLVVDKGCNKTFIQCKKHNKNVGINVIKELTATIEHNSENVHDGIAICTHAVTNGAKNLLPTMV